MKAPTSRLNAVGDFDVAILRRAPRFRPTYRPCTAFGPRGIRRISALLHALQLTRWALTCASPIRALRCGRHLHDFPPQPKKSFRSDLKGVANVFSSGAFPIILGGDTRSVFPPCAAIRLPPSGRQSVGIIHFDRHVRTQE